MNIRVKIALFAVAAVAQVAAPVSMIVKREIVLRQGVTYKFKTQPVDPADVFRGRYVQLAIAENTAPLQKGHTFDYNQTIYAVLTVGEDGFAKFAGVTTSPPAGGDYLKTTVAYIDYETLIARLNLPFDRYYLDEELAPEAERLYRAHSQPGQHDAYIAVRVRNGFAVLEELYIADTPVLDFIAQQASEKSEP